MPEHAPSVAESQQVVQTWATRLDAQVIEREENWGLARSIVDGVTDLCNQYGRVIVLEDDLILSPDFLDFMLQALDHYQDESRIYQVSGYMFPANALPSQDTYLLSSLTTSWGWATWKRAWAHYEWEEKEVLDFLASPDNRTCFDFDGRFPFSAILEQRINGQNDSWGILWRYIVFKLDGLVLYPRTSLVLNEGFDGSGVHSRNSPELIKNLSIDVSKVILPHPLHFPEVMATDEEALSPVLQFLGTRMGYGQKSSLLRRVRNHIVRLSRVIRS